MPIERSIVPAEGLVQPSTPYSQILRVRCGELAFISGQVAVDEKGVTVGDDIDSQMEQVFKNLKTNQIVNGERVDTKRNIAKAFETIKPEYVRKCIAHCHQTLQL